MKKKLYLVLALLVVLAATGGTFAFTATSATTGPGISAVGVSGDFATVSTNVANGRYRSNPAWNPAAGAAGQIPDADASNTAGDIYIIDTGTYTGDILVTIYLNNPSDLASSYSYLNLAINAYGKEGTTTPTWKTTGVLVDASNGYSKYLTLTNGYVSFTLTHADSVDEAGDGATHHYYAITIDAGSFYCFKLGNLAPSFYIDVRQA